MRQGWYGKPLHPCVHSQDAGAAIYHRPAPSPLTARTAEPKPPFPPTPANLTVMNLTVTQVVDNVKVVAEVGASRTFEFKPLRECTGIAPISV